ncbi:MAG: hypothetical protein GPOALKHO_000520 [Sodalis sp.]|nr:MAG: hypothetical protein GPOALKHO_000520 [Sodalis sp.]
MASYDQPGRPSASPGSRGAARRAGAFKTSSELAFGKRVKPVVQPFELNGETYWLDQGAVVIATITSCTNTSNTNILMAAGLRARNVINKEPHRKPLLKTPLAPDSKAVTDYLEAAGLTLP